MNLLPRRFRHASVSERCQYFLLQNKDNTSVLKLACFKAALYITQNAIRNSCNNAEFKHQCKSSLLEVSLKLRVRNLWEHFMQAASYFNLAPPGS